MPSLLPRESMNATSVIPAPSQRPSPSVHRVGFSNSFTRLLIGSLALRPALLLFGNSRPRVTTTPLPHATGAYGQLPRRDFNPLDLLLLLRTVRPRLSVLVFLFYGWMSETLTWPRGFPIFLFSRDTPLGSPRLRLITLCRLIKIIRKIRFRVDSNYIACYWIINFICTTRHLKASSEITKHWIIFLNIVFVHKY